MIVAFEPHIENADDIRMRKSGGGFSLALEAFDELDIVFVSGMKDFDGDRSSAMPPEPMRSSSSYLPLKTRSVIYTSLLFFCIIRLILRHAHHNDGDVVFAAVFERGFHERVRRLLT